MDFIASVKQQYLYYKSLGEKAMAQVSDENLFNQVHAESNSIATIVKHLHGNMISRWTDFLTTDGEKPNRDRDGEFLNDTQSRDAIMLLWNAGWECLFKAIDEITIADIDKIIFIRNEGHTVMEALLRQLAHYSYHVGQIVFASKLYNEHFTSLSIPRNSSAKYNEKKFEQAKGIRHFTDDFLK